MQLALLHQGFHEEFPRGKLTAVMGGHAGALQTAQLPVVPQIGETIEQSVQRFQERPIFLQVRRGAADIQGGIAFGAGFEEKDRREEVKVPQDGDHFPVGRQPPLEPAVRSRAGKGGDFFIQSVLHHQGHEAA